MLLQEAPRMPAAHSASRRGTRQTRQQPVHRWGSNNHMVSDCSVCAPVGPGHRATPPAQYGATSQGVRFRSGDTPRSRLSHLGLGVAVPAFPWGAGQSRPASQLTCV